MYEDEDGARGGLGNNAHARAPPATSSPPAGTATHLLLQLLLILLLRAHLLLHLPVHLLRFPFVGPDGFKRRGSAPGGSTPGVTSASGAPTGSGSSREPGGFGERGRRVKAPRGPPEGGRGPTPRTDPLENMLRMLGCRPELRVTLELAGDPVGTTARSALAAWDALPCTSHSPQAASSPLPDPPSPEQGKETPKPHPEGLCYPPHGEPPRSRSVLNRGGRFPAAFYAAAKAEPLLLLSPLDLLLLALRARGMGVEEEEEAAASSISIALSSSPSGPARSESSSLP